MLYLYVSISDIYLFRCFFLLVFVLADLGGSSCPVCECFNEVVWCCASVFVFVCVFAL